MARARSGNGPIDLGFLFRPKSRSQEIAAQLWQRSRILFLLGGAGTGKTATAIGLALGEILKSEKATLLLSRPAVSCDEDLGFEPGDLAAKLGTWMGPFRDVCSSLTVGGWDVLQRSLDQRLELVPIGRLRGRTIRNGILIADECQNCTYAQLVCALTRIGERGRIILSGDVEQSDRFDRDSSPLDLVARRLGHLDTVSVVRFDSVRDQVRDPLVSEILNGLNGPGAIHGRR